MSEHVPQTDPTPASLPAPRCPRRWVTVLLMVVIFASGAAIGSGLTFMYIEHRRAFYQDHPEELPKRFAQRLRGELRLSAAQTEQVRVLIERRWPDFQEARRIAMEPQVKALHAEVAQVLRPDQRARWDEFIDRINRAWAPPATTSASAATTGTAPSTAPASQ
jgi:hypothetical protein